MQFDREKLKALIIYACSQCEPHQIGQTKLHKLLYFADMLSYANTGAAITGAEYRKRPHGPTCDALLSALDELERDGKLDVTVQNYFGFAKKEFLPKVDADLSRFTADEKALIDEVIQFVCKNNSARTISEFSHNRAWEMAEFGDVLPYVSAFYMLPTQVSPEAFDWAEAEAAKFADQRSSTHVLDFEDHAVFRRRIRAAL